MQSRILKIILYLIFQVTSVCCESQNFNPYYNFKQLNVQNGLVQNIVYHFLQDSRGYIWLGTRNGITLFDGIRSIQFQHTDNDKNSLTGNFITRILEDNHHIVWVGNNAGIDRFNQADNSFTHFGIPSTGGQKENTYCVLLGFTNGHELWFIDANAKAIKIFDTDKKTFRFVIATDAVDGVMYSDPVHGIVHIWNYLSISTTHIVFRSDSVISRQSYFNSDKKLAMPSLLIFHVYDRMILSHGWQLCGA